MGGIFLGFLCAAILLLLLGRLRATQPPGGALGLACWALIALTGFDGLNAFLADGSLPHLYPPNTALRLLTGLGAGLAVGLFALPVVASVIWAAALPEASLDAFFELAAGLALVGLVGALVLAGVGVLLWPIGLAMLLSVVVAFGVANVYVLALATGRTGLAVGFRDLNPLLLSSLGLVLLELGALAFLRGWRAATYGFSWGI